MSLSSDILGRYGRREQNTRRCELVYKSENSRQPPQRQPEKLWAVVKPKVAAELVPVEKKLKNIEKTRITAKDAETMIDTKLAKLEKQNRRRHDDLYNKLREL